MSTSNATPNYQVTAENAAGLLFKNKRDRKILNVDPKVWFAVASFKVETFFHVINALRIALLDAFYVTRKHQKHSGLL